MQNKLTDVWKSWFPQSGQHGMTVTDHNGCAVPGPVQNHIPGANPGILVRGVQFRPEFWKSDPRKCATTPTSFSPQKNGLLWWTAWYWKRIEAKWGVPPPCVRHWHLCGEVGRLHLASSVIYHHCRCIPKVQAESCGWSCSCDSSDGSDGGGIWLCVYVGCVNIFCPASLSLWSESSFIFWAGATSPV